MPISVKWPAARMIGPEVSPENAREFIRRTDKALIGEGFTNDRLFERQLKALIGFDEPSPNERVDWAKRYARQEAYANAFGHVSLEHLGSQWVQCAWVGGPNGPVSPTGRVSLAKNFGKYPSETEIEDDLTKIAEAFPWLTFTLAVWGHQEEGDDGLPSDLWELSGGKWERGEPREARWPQEYDFSNFLSALSLGNRREITWDISGIERMWGDQISSARVAADEAINSEESE